MLVVQPTLYFISSQSFGLRVWVCISLLGLTI